MKEPFNLHHLPNMRNKHHVFADREDAGNTLASMLSPLHKGGELALAGALGGDLDMVVVRKLQIPGNTEAGFGAMTLDGRVHLNRELMSRMNITGEQIEAEKRTVARELERRNQRFRQGRKPPDVTGRSVILVDDGLASGYTMLAALAAVRDGKPARVVVAVPTAPMSSILKVHTEADEIFCANVQDTGPFAVAAAYRRWHDLEPGEVEDMLARFGT
jgi:predicted phosphoribosyltransferase